MSTEPYDPEVDPDADPESLNPRADQSAGTAGDPDADPGALNPRAQGAQDEPQTGDDPTGFQD